ncbi:hypothetical protein [Corynebacterium timonense]|uniref:Uncharacterized protein n=1 Tax=Corynebacterium timonense TaxID=441500 RepID=A0A1H1RQQ6_9CORY|nr:hypothetical protein [Corynebacterium timonense]SDS37942.1 hypothetical protein SAMN04488539_1559 [Corynebacterium timonense]
MYYPVPGHQHIKVVVQPPARPRPPAPRAVTRGTDRPSPLVAIALDAAFGVREASSLAHAQYAARVRGHINARRRANAPAGPVRILTCHAREGGEFFGTVHAGGRRYAYVARIEGGTLVSFKVL